MTIRPAWCFISAVLFLSSPLSAGPISIIDLGNLGANDKTTYAYGVSSNGLATGFSAAGSGTSQGYYYNGAIHTIGSPLGGNYSAGYSINSSGAVAGFATVAGDGVDSSRAIVYSNGVMQNLQLPISTWTYSQANGINENGQVVGTARLTNGQLHAFYYDGAMHDIGGIVTNITQHSQAYAISDSGYIVGHIGNFEEEKAFVYNGTTTKLVSGIAKAFAVNESGQVTGLARVDNLSRPYLYSFTTDVKTLLPTPSDQTGEGHGINDQGDVVGFLNYSFEPNVHHAFYYHNGSSVDMNTLISPSSGWVLNDAFDINNAGQIVGIGTINGETHAFMIAVPEPSGLALVALGLAGIVGVCRRRRAI